MIKVKGSRGVKYAKELVDILFTELEMKKWQDMSKNKKVYLFLKLFAGLLQLH